MGLANWRALFLALLDCSRLVGPVLFFSVGGAGVRSSPLSICSTVVMNHSQASFSVFPNKTNVEWKTRIRLVQTNTNALWARRILYLWSCYLWDADFNMLGYQSNFFILSIRSTYNCFYVHFSYIFYICHARSMYITIINLYIFTGYLFKNKFQ